MSIIPLIVVLIMILYVFPYLWVSLWLWGIFIACAALMIWASQQREKDVNAHMQNLKKGGLIPRAPQDIHREALKRIGKASLGMKLPKREYYDDK